MPRWTTRWCPSSSETARNLPAAPHGHDRVPGEAGAERAQPVWWRRAACRPVTVTVLNFKPDESLVEAARTVSTSGSSGTAAASHAALGLLRRSAAFLRASPRRCPRARPALRTAARCRGARWPGAVAVKSWRRARRGRWPRPILAAGSSRLRVAGSCASAPRRRSGPQHDGRERRLRDAGREVDGADDGFEAVGEDATCPRPPELSSPRPSSSASPSHRARRPRRRASVLTTAATHPGEVAFGQIGKAAEE